MEALQRLHNRGSVPTGYEIDNSVKLEADNTEYFSRTPSSATNRQTFTFSTWVKRAELGLNSTFIDVRANSTTWTVLGFDTNDRIVVYAIEGVTDYGYQYTPRYRDTAAWYHIVWKSDITNATAANRWQVYVNGVEITAKDVDYGTPPTDFSTLINNTNLTTVGYNSDSSNSASQYMAETHLIDGIALAPTEFGEYDEDTGIWKPKAYTGSYGYDINHTGGFYLNFKSSGSLGADSSGNGNNFSLNNITSADQATDTPTNNFCTLFPPPAAVTGTAPSIKEGGTTMFGGVTDTQNAFGTIGVRSGKWYFESTITNSGGVGTENHGFGVIDPEQITYVMTSGRDIGASPAGWSCASNSSPRNNNAAAANANATGALAENEIMGVAIDMDNGKIWWHRQGTWTSINGTAGNPANGTTPAFSNLLTATDNFVIPASGFYVNNGNQARAMNFGGYAQAVFTAVGTYTDANGYGSFAYQPPSGYYALCTKNLEEYG